MWLKKQLWMFNRRFLEPDGDSELWRDPERRLGATLGMLLLTEWRLVSFVAWYSHWSQKWQSGPEDGSSCHTVMILPLITITTLNLVRELTCMNSVITGDQGGGGEVESLVRICTQSTMAGGASSGICTL